MENAEHILEVNQLSVRKGSLQVLESISFSLKQGDHLAITGTAGSGKTSLALALAGRIFFSGQLQYAGKLNERIVWVEQEHHFKNLSNTSNFYYQQRFNSMDSEDAITVAAYLGGKHVAEMELLRPFDLGRLLDEPLIQLSNGENKKVQIAKALLAFPKVLVLDQPFVGLDVNARTFLHQRINELADKGILIILATHPSEIPSCITKVISLEKSQPAVFRERKAFDEQMPSAAKRQELNEVLLKRVLNIAPGGQFNAVIQMKNVNVSYGDKKILQQVNWEVKEGERWLLSGPNGAGKSTLLSLITADNPQAYANEIYLFDRKRGSGESIWDIKKRIGYLSPELILFFDSSNSVFEAVASGLFDTIGLFRQVTDEQMQRVYDWLELLGIRSLARKRLNEVSAGEQRRALLARALIKNPPLLILDEPCQGLDDETEDGLLDLINAVCVAGNKTLIYVTHYANKRPECVNRIIRLESGCVIQSGILEN
ncbi:MAG TPA: ATP-binding cassette domain-containing protein [Chitinophagaceae bacterium]|nr:ATP-binding cassette domain-containing protein [Chitinophagaceae bacterium]